MHKPYLPFNQLYFSHFGIHLCCCAWPMLTLFNAHFIHWANTTIGLTKCFKCKHYSVREQIYHTPTGVRKESTYNLIAAHNIFISIYEFCNSNNRKKTDVRRFRMENVCTRITTVSASNVSTNTNGRENFKWKRENKTIYFFTWNFLRFFIPFNSLSFVVFCFLFNENQIDYILFTAAKHFANFITKIHELNLYARW